MHRKTSSFSSPKLLENYLIWVVLLILPFPVQINAQQSPMNPGLINQFKRNVAEMAEKTQSISSSFTQEKGMSMIADKIISSGQFFFKKERMLRWEYSEPFSYLIVICNDKISIKDESNVSHFNVSSNKIFLEINRIILGAIQGTLLTDEKNFSVSFFDSPAAYITKLYPTSPKLKSTVSEIVIYFSHNNFSVDKVDMIESGGDKTRIIFHDRIFNKSIPDEKFVVD
jgi:outer membrane lipoprotein-sorting protein